MNSLREGLFQVPAMLIAAVFCCLIFTLNWFGHSVRKSIAKRNPEKDISLGTAEGALMGLMALLLAFSFSMSATKFEGRRQTIIDEVNLINTVFLRCQLFPDSARGPMLAGLKNYVDSRIAYFDAGDNPQKINEALANTDKYFNDVWKKNALLINDVNTRFRGEQLVLALINMRNIVTTREAARVAAVPTLILAVLLTLVFVASFLTGYGVKPGNRSPLFSLAFAIMTSVVLYLVMELGRPRQGYINLKGAEQELVDLRKVMS